MARLTPEDLAFADAAPVIAEATRVISGTPDDVWATILDYPGWTRWFTGLKTCRATSDPPTGVGSTREVTVAGGIKVVERFIAWDEPHVWAFTATEGPPMFARLVERVTIRPLDDERAEVTYRMAIGPTWWSAPMLKLARPRIVKTLATALDGLDQAVAADRAAR